MRHARPLFLADSLSGRSAAGAAGVQAPDDACAAVGLSPAWVGLRLTSEGAAGRVSTLASRPLVESVPLSPCKALGLSLSPLF